ncbi:phage Gp37/Gp68 family protein [Streptomyces sp. MS1.AVA.3]|uniref:DUF5131 family protein n=1 Tax=Streptomyces decoyicus TaxID=249567 RepID=UPI0030C238CC
MSTTTSIEWARNADGSPGKTWNPVSGCDRVSDGCTNCYAMTMARRLKAMGARGYDKDGHPKTSGPGFGVWLHDWDLTMPLQLRKPTRIFVNSMSDLFHKDVPDEYIARVFAVMLASERHTFQVLTKRHARMQALVSSNAFREQVDKLAVGEYGSMHVAQYKNGWWPLPNLWLGVSVENQDWANKRIPALLRTPATVRFISAEPLLGPVDLTRILYQGDTAYVVDALDGRYGEREPHTSFRYGMAGLEPVDWVIAGGESGPKARPMHAAWARSLRDQCSKSRRGVPFLFKQWGEYRPFWRPDTDGRPCSEPVLYVNAETGEALPEAEVPDTGSWQGVHRLGKKKAGKELDGRTWLQTPAPTNTEPRR